MVTVKGTPRPVVISSTLSGETHPLFPGDSVFVLIPPVAEKEMVAEKKGPLNTVLIDHIIKFGYHTPLLQLALGDWTILYCAYV